MLGGAGAGLVRGGGEAGAAVLGEHDPVGSGALGTADDSPQVPGVLDAVTDHHEGVLAQFLRPGQDVLQGTVCPGGGHGDHALMGAGDAHGVQLPPVTLRHHRPGAFGAGGDKSQGLVGAAPDEEYLVDGAAGADGLGDSVFSLYYVFF